MMSFARTRGVAERIARLGTETAFAVSAEADEWRDQGHKVYPFHLGDIDLPTPQNIVDAAEKAIRDGKTGYCPNAGITPLREALAADVGASHLLELAPQNVAIEPGGKPVIGKFILALMDPGDEVLYPNPGYPIYESQIEFHGGIAKPYGYVEGADNFELDFDQTRKRDHAQDTPAHLQQPAEPDRRRKHDDGAGAPRRAGTRKRPGRAERRGLLGHPLLGRQPRPSPRCPAWASARVILYTFSKKFAMTGWRLGAAIGPSEYIDVIARLNVNDESCSNHFIQYGALEGLTGDQSGPRRIVETLKERRDAAVRLLNEVPGVRCFKPESTFYLFPNVTGLMEQKGFGSYDELRRGALEQTGVSFCTRLHFGRALPGEVEHYARFAYSGIGVGEIEEGLEKLKQWART